MTSMFMFSRITSPRHTRTHREIHLHIDERICYCALLDALEPTMLMIFLFVAELVLQTMHSPT